MTKAPIKLPPPVFDDPKHHIRLYQGDSLQLLALLPESSFDLIFADPPYFLSNGGITCHAGKMVSVNKGAWDKSQGPAANHEFNRSWLAACQRVLKPNGSLWVSGNLKLVQTELRFYFIGRQNRTVIFSVQAPTLDEALQQFRNSGHSPSDALFIIKSETQIFLA